MIGDRAVLSETINDKKSRLFFTATDLSNSRNITNETNNCLSLIQDGTRVLSELSELKQNSEISLLLRSLRIFTSTHVRKTKPFLKSSRKSGELIPKNLVKQSKLD